MATHGKLGKGGQKRVAANEGMSGHVLVSRRRNTLQHVRREEFEETGEGVTWWPSRQRGRGPRGRERRLGCSRPPEAVARLGGTRQQGRAFRLRPRPAAWAQL